MMCEIFNVSCSSYYSWLYRPKTPREQENEVIGEHLKLLFKEGRKNYGTRRLKNRLKETGYVVSRRRIGKLMKVNKLFCKTRLFSA